MTVEATFALFLIYFPSSFHMRTTLGIASKPVNNSVGQLDMLIYICNH